MPSSPPAPPRLDLDPAGFPALGGRRLDLPPKPRAALALMAERPGDVVRKEAFAQAAWAGRPMSDESLARCISAVRRALAGSGWRVEPVYGTGYVLQAPGASTLIDEAAFVPDPADADTLRHAVSLTDQRTPAAVSLALTLLRELAARRPGYGAARVALAHALTAAIGWGLAATAPAVAEGLAALDGQDAADAPGRVTSARGALLDMAWRFDEARRAHAQARERAPADVAVLQALARHLLVTGEPAAAGDVLDEVHRLAPHTPNLRALMARARVQAGRGADALACARAGVAEHPGELFPVAFEMAIRALVAPDDALAAAAQRLADLPDPPPWVWTVLAFVLARTGRREAALDVIDSALLCSHTTVGEATLYAAPLAALGEVERAAALLARAHADSCGMLAMVLRDPANASLVGEGGAAADLLPKVFARMP